jgi:hypothetical protein
MHNYLRKIYSTSCSQQLADRKAPCVCRHKQLMHATPSQYIRKRAFSYAGPAWNSLPPEVRASPDLAVLKRIFVQPLIILYPPATCYLLYNMLMFFYVIGTQSI